MTPEVFMRRIEELQQRGALRFAFDPIIAWAVISTLQIALRHPRFPASTRQIITSVVNAMGGEFPAEFQPLIAQGFDPQFDGGEG